MSNTIPLQNWIEVKAHCRKLDYLFVELDAVARRVHMPQDIFFGLASQIDWRLLARRQLLRLAETKGYKVDGIDLGPSTGLFDAIANANWLESESVFRDIRPEIESSVSKNLNLAKDFRVAMSHLCVREYMRYGEEYTGHPIIDWLTGSNTRISNVRPFSIYTGIDRTTARYFLESALYWVRYAGYAGTVILLENYGLTEIVTRLRPLIRGTGPKVGHRTWAPVGSPVVPPGAWPHATPAADTVSRSIPRRHPRTLRRNAAWNR